MWLARPAPTQRGPNDDWVDWARKETWAFAIWKCKVYGVRVSLTVALIVFISAGMPGYFLWRWLSLPLVIIFYCSFAPLLFYAGMAIGELLDRD